MNILIAGEDEAAVRLAEALMEEHSVTLLCPDALDTARLDRLDVAVHRGDSADADVLGSVGAAQAGLFVACTSTDERNLVACVTAKRLGSRRTTCFLWRRQAQRSEQDAIALARLLGIDNVVLPAARLAKEILRIVMVPGALEVEAFEGGRVRLVRRAIEAGAAITQCTLGQAGIPDGVVLVMGKRGEEAFIPTGSTQFKAEDQVTAMGTLAGINRLIYRHLRAQGAERRGRLAAIVGGGTVGLSVALGLEEAGWKVKVIESDLKRCEEIAPRLKGRVLHFDGADLDRLEEEAIGDSSVLIAVTSHDEKNLMVSLVARHLGVPRIITRADRPVNERLFEKVGVDVVKSARGAAVQSVVRSVVAARHDLMAELDHGDVVVLRLQVPHHREPVPLHELQPPVFAVVGAILRESRVIVPRGRDLVCGGDHLLVFCARDDEDKVRRYFLRFEL